MKRREFITLLGGAVTWPLPASAQQTPKLPTIGFLSPTTASVENQRVAAFVHRLRELGWIEARTVGIKVRWAEGGSERAAEIVAEFVRQKVDVIVSRGTVSVLAAKQATSVIPIVFAGGDPVGTGFVVSPGATGWQCHGPIVPADRSCWQTTRTFARGCPCSSPVSDIGQCRQSRHPAGYA
jgi:putative ABC transport system substrate-binding protein